jgi:hypothetical protein
MLLLCQMFLLTQHAQIGLSRSLSARPL